MPWKFCFFLFSRLMPFWTLIFVNYRYAFLILFYYIHVFQENKQEMITSGRIILTKGHPAWARGTPFPPLILPSLRHLLLFITFSLFPFLIHFTYFLLLSIRSLSTRIVPLRFQAWGRRRRPNLGLVCFVLWLCYLYWLVKFYSGILLYLL